MIVVIAIGVIIVIVAGRRGDVASILLCIDVMDLLVEVNTGCIRYSGCISPTIFVPKHHFMLHSKQLERFKFLVAGSPRLHQPRVSMKTASPLT